MSIQGSEIIDWDDLILELLSCPPDVLLADSPGHKSPYEELAMEVVTLAIEDAKISRPSEDKELLPDGCCPACFLLDTLQDPDCIWNQAISHCLHPKVIKEWAEKNAIHWCQGEKPANKPGRPRKNLFPLATGNQQEEAA